MPTYDYQDDNGHKTSVTVTYAQYDAMGDMVCLVCGQTMKRVYEVVPVNWNGLPPHEADRRPKQIQKWIDDAPERRAKYPELKGNLSNGKKIGS